MQYQKLFHLLEGRLSIQLLRIPWLRLEERLEKDGFARENAEMVGCHAADAGTLIHAKRG
jgi:hypothetical protein